MSSTPLPGDDGRDPYEIEWPDDAKDLRAAERAAQAKRALVRPAPLYLSAAVIGLGTVLVFILPVSLVAGSTGIFIALSAPIIVGGLVLALPPALLLARASREWRRGLPELAFIALGAAVGAGWTWVFLTAFQRALFADAVQMAAVRAPSSVFMGTAVASAFMGARAFARPFSAMPKAVYSAAGLITLLALSSVYANLFL